MERIPNNENGAEEADNVIRVDFGKGEGRVQRPETSTASSGADRGGTFDVPSEEKSATLREESSEIERAFHEDDEGDTPASHERDHG